VTGVPREGQTLAANAGIWTGATSYFFQWLTCDAAGFACAPVRGATSPSYLLGSADVGHALRVVVTGASPAGSMTVTSAAFGPIAVASAAPPPAAPPAAVAPQPPPVAAPAPPPPVAPPASAPPVQAQPTSPLVSSAAFSLSAVPRAGRRPVRSLKVQLSVCGGAAGKLDAVIHERRVYLHRTRAERFMRRVLAASTQSCRAYKIEWRVRNKFFGPGLHSVVIHVRDSLGHVSNGVKRSYGTAL
jgi:hypothetical protein